MLGMIWEHFVSEILVLLLLEIKGGWLDRMEVLYITLLPSFNLGRSY